jgi:hypothetical protein
MLTRRNRFFAAAALTASVSTAIFTVGNALDVHRLSGETLVGGYVASAAIFLASQAIATAGWALVAIAFGEEIDWRRLWLGGAIVATSYVVFFGGTIFRLVAILSSIHGTRYGDAGIAASFAALSLGLATCVVVFGFTAGNRVAKRASRLWLGGVLAVVSLLATALGVRSPVAKRSSSAPPRWPRRRPCWSPAAKP